ncbi:MAG: porin [Acetobacteraceae bacterium]|nr:porin [Acetobacteraceae bacterium]
MQNKSSRGHGRRASLPALVGLCVIGASASALAQAGSTQNVVPGAISNPVAPAGAATLPAASSGWASTIKLGFQGDAGIVGNTLSPDNNRNFGMLFTDSANRPVLNQLLATISRDIDPKATSVDYGFKLQAMYGSDSRITHTLGVFDHAIHDRNQFDIVEADVTVHLPYLFAGGLDIKAGIFPTPLGVEVIDPKGNPFYTHSYIFNYGLPFKHTGVLAEAHVNDMVDLYLGIDSGVDTGIAYGAGDNNQRPSGIVGFGLNFDKLTVLALSHMGPENPKPAVPFANSAMRYLNDVAFVYKATEKLTLTAELNYIRDAGFHAEGYGISGYASYALNDSLTLNGRAEVFRDNNNFFVSTPAGSLDFVAAERGTLANLITAARPTTYGELTAGVTYKIPGLPQTLTTALFRPEVRYDRSLNDTTPFGDGKHKGRVIFAGDLILGF